MNLPEVVDSLRSERSRTLQFPELLEYGIHSTLNGWRAQHKQYRLYLDKQNKKKNNKQNNKKKRMN